MARDLIVCPGCCFTESGENTDADLFEDATERAARLRQRLPVACLLEGRRFTFTLLSLRGDAPLASHKESCWGQKILAQLSASTGTGTVQESVQPQMLEIRRPVQNLNQLLMGMEQVIDAGTGTLLALSFPQQVVLPLFGGSSNRLFAALDELVFGSTFHLNVSSLFK